MDIAIFSTKQEVIIYNIFLQLWSGPNLLERASRLPDDYPMGDPSNIFENRDYQEKAIQALMNTVSNPDQNRALVVMATGLGKTRVTCEFLRRQAKLKPIRVLSLAHTNALVYQLEKAFWPYLKADAETLVWNGYEEQAFADLQRAPYVFACLNTVASYVQKGGDLPDYDFVFVDECHHVGDEGMYSQILDSMMAGKS